MLYSRFIQFTVTRLLNNNVRTILTVVTTEHIDALPKVKIDDQQAIIKLQEVIKKRSDELNEVKSTKLKLKRNPTRQL